METNLRISTFKLLRNRPAHIKLADVAKDSGLPLSWIKSFHINGDRKNSSSDKVQTLYEHLSGKKLPL